MNFKTNHSDIFMNKNFPDENNCIKIQIKVLETFYLPFIEN